MGMTAIYGRYEGEVLGDVTGGEYFDTELNRRNCHEITLALDNM